MQEIVEPLARLVGEAKRCRTAAECVTVFDSLAAIDLAQDLAHIGQSFINLSVQIKQEARKAADAAAASRPKWAPPGMNAKRAADAIVKAGGYRVPV